VYDSAQNRNTAGQRDKVSARVSAYHHAVDEDFIPRDLIARMGHAAADNALELVDEANLLEEQGHSARAFALTVLAAEELGKAFICEITVAHAHEDLDDWQVFAAMVAGKKRHETKLLGALFLIQEVPGTDGQPVVQLARELRDLTANDLDAAKMSALYVDLEAGEVATPARVAEHRGAQQRARALRKEIVGWAIALGLEPLDDT
jgi:AbiV family abortive infection protein